jgi:hypothetical protein
MIETFCGAEPGFARAQPTFASAISTKGKGAHGGNRPFPPCFQAIRSILEENAAARPSTGASSAKRVR